MIAILFLKMFTTAYSIDNEYCLRLKDQLNANDVQSQLLKWVDDNFYQKKVIKRNQITTYYTGIRPGKYTLLEHGFNWGLLEFDQLLSRIKLIGLETSDFYQKYSHPSSAGKTAKQLRKPASINNVDSILFSEKSYYGIIVRLDNSNDFIDKKHQKYLQPVSDRIAILCGSKYIRGQK